MVWEWTKEHGIDHAEHRSVCPDAQGDRSLLSFFGLFLTEINVQSEDSKTQDQRPNTYSYRSATNGSTFVARRAGR